MAINIKLNDVIGRLHDAAKQQANKKVQNIFQRLVNKNAKDPSSILFVNTAIKTENGKPSEFIGKPGEEYNIYVARLNIFGGTKNLLNYIYKVNNTHWSNICQTLPKP